jgi:hypothetical protein
MSDHNPLFDVRRYTLTLIISFVVLVIFSLLMMMWHGSYEKDTNGKMHYNTRVNEPNTNY